VSKPVEPCIIPWVSFSTNTFGKSRPCGYSAFKSIRPLGSSTITREFNGEVFRTVRREFLSGQWPKNCDRCKYMEQTESTPSKRAMEKARYPELAALIARTSSDGSVKHFPEEIDIRLGSVCNLKCIHCGVGNSSKWLEDEELIGKYQNTISPPVNNRWVDHETPMWKELFEHLPVIRKFNFVGGEPFASRQHGRFIERVSRTPFARQISLHYVTNGTLLSEAQMAVLKKFKRVTINISLDATGPVLEFFRFPIEAKALEETLLGLENSLTEAFDLRLQWTSSNVSIFYLDETLDFYEQRFKKIQFKFCNFVDFPSHMSAQNLPQSVKRQIRRKLEPYLQRYPEIDFYLRQMDENEGWGDHGPLLFQYLDDLSRVRKVDWRSNFRQFADAIGSAP